RVPRGEKSQRRRRLSGAGTGVETAMRRARRLAPSPRLSRRSPVGGLPGGGLLAARRLLFFARLGRGLGAGFLGTARSRLALLGLLATLLRLGGGALDELDHRHRGGITGAHTELGDAGVATVALAVARGNLVEELLQDVAAPDDAGGAPPGGERPALPERDHAIGPAPHLLR